jgi:hypothetical protein
VINVPIMGIGRKSALRLDCRFVRKGLKGHGRKTALRFCFWSLRSAQTPCLYPEVNPRSGFTTGTPDKPEFFAEQKMRPNSEVFKSPYIC